MCATCVSGGQGAPGARNPFSLGRARGLQGARCIERHLRTTAQRHKRQNMDNKAVKTTPGPCTRRHLRLALKPWQTLATPTVAAPHFAWDQSIIHPARISASIPVQNDSCPSNQIALIHYHFYVIFNKSPKSQNSRTRTGFFVPRAALARDESCTQKEREDVCAPVQVD